MRGAGLVQLMLAIGIDQEPPAQMFSEQPPARMETMRRYRLRWKPRTRIDDAFLADVAHAYQAAIAFGLNPRKAIVEDTGAADATVAGWIVEARKRGKLPKTTPGRVIEKASGAMVRARASGEVTAKGGSDDG
jgi:hypothetical protein